ncbi:MAG: tRNA 4-thiouridine(8) synthase ThiI [Christensenellaceae bacterium]|jgi:thiamine biosynthesis protein ThiI|nr:tRNA 4-thiouridine(8) synthase ThiI [Christensenellaceae bacterium]
MMINENVILIRYGELFLKGNNKSWFESILHRNIKNAINGINCRIVNGRSRCYIEDFDSNCKANLISRLSKVFGLHSISHAIKTVTNIDEICKIASDITPKSGVFRVSVKRADNHILKNSMDIAADIGAYMLNHAPELKVNLFNYDFELNVDIRENGYSYLFFDKIMCVGGLPYSSGGRGMLLLSGGIDSPVAAYTMAKRGVRIFAIHYHSYPHTGELALQKVTDIVKKLHPYIPSMELTSLPLTEIQYAIRDNCPEEYTITLLRRFMMRIAERLANKKNCGAIITGESLGQVASQTMESINVINSVVKLPVLRPLIGFDKDEIISIAKKIETYDISIRPFQDCCTVFLPKKPVIHPTLENAIKFEEKLNIDELINKAILEGEILISKSDQFCDNDSI